MTKAQGAILLLLPLHPSTAPLYFSWIAEQLSSYPVYSDSTSGSPCPSGVEEESEAGLPASLLSY